MWVKICGIMTMRAALAAADAGADAVGFIFAKSRRQVTPDRAQSLIMGLPKGLERVGIFVDEDSQEVRRIALHAGLTCVQLHGSEPPEAIAAVGLPVIKAFRIKGEEDLAQLPAYRAAAGLLLDPYVEGQHGGTGTTIDWSLIPKAEAILRAAGVELAGPKEGLTAGRPKLILAGGLSPDNVEPAVQAASPGGLDVSSGVETDGQKDTRKIYDFVDKAKEASV